MAVDADRVRALVNLVMNIRFQSDVYLRHRWLLKEDPAPWS
jgi:hypothetical protein